MKELFKRKGIFINCLRAGVYTTTIITTTTTQTENNNIRKREAGAGGVAWGGRASFALRKPFAPYSIPITFTFEFIDFKPVFLQNLSSLYK